MIDLDDLSVLRELDRDDMLGEILAFPRKADEGFRSGAAASPLPSLDGVTAVAYCGMGGSAVPGDVLRALFRSRLGMPVDVHRSPELPGYCGPSTLVICCSYSGGTSETIATFDEAVARGCRSLVLTSGGDLEARARSAGASVVGVPAGMMPRAAVASLVFSLLGALEAAGLLPRLQADVTGAVAEAERLVGDLRPEVPVGSNPAKRLATLLLGRTPVVWGADGIGAVAADRWRAAWNENAKLPAFSSAIPELDHNEIVGWSHGAGRDFAVVALRHDDEHPDVAARFAPSLEIARASGAEVVEIQASGATPLARLCSLVLLGDLASAYAGLARGIDPSPIDAITGLKATLAGSS